MFDFLFIVHEQNDVAIQRRGGPASLYVIRAEVPINAMEKITSPASVNWKTLLACPASNLGFCSSPKNLYPDNDRQRLTEVSAIAMMQ
jgi:hypothetical protein